MEIQVSLSEVQIFAGGKLVAAHPLQEGRHQQQLASGHRRWPPPGAHQKPQETSSLVFTLPGERVARRSLEIYERIGAALAQGAQR